MKELEKENLENGEIEARNKAILVELETRYDDVSKFSENAMNVNRSRKHENLHSEKKVSEIIHLIY